MSGGPSDVAGVIATNESGRHRATRPSRRPKVGRHRATRSDSAARRRTSRLVVGTSVVMAPLAFAAVSGVGGGDSGAGGRSARPRPAIQSAIAAPTIDKAPALQEKSSPSSAPQPRRTDGPDVSRSGRRTHREPRWLATCLPPSFSTLANGAVPEANLCQLPGETHLLTRDAAESWSQLARRYAERFGVSACITDSYRSLAAQSSLYAAKPGLAARPGTSNHGWGVALDLCGGADSFGSDEYEWLRQYGERWGWVNPDWAGRTGSKPEPWHWEYQPR